MTVAMSARAEAQAAYREMKKSTADLERRFRETQVRARVRVCVCIVKRHRPRQPRLTNGKTSAAADKNRRLPKEAKTRRTDGQSPKAKRCVCACVVPQTPENTAFPVCSATNAKILRANPSACFHVFVCRREHGFCSRSRRKT